ncbi:MAG TPA: carbohydrate ABC transporter permease [Bellilinea sp.]|nr:carbohydrate ABC transporter permease [Bellilinea sp.]
MRKLPWLRQLLSQLALLIIGVYVIIPIWSTLRLAFDGSLISRATEFRWLPKVFSLEPLLAVLDRPYQSVDFLTLFRNSVIVSLGAAILATILGASLAYAFARFRFPGRKPGLVLLLLTAVIPPVAFSTPLYIVLSILQIRTSLIGLVIVYTVFALPFCIWNMRAAFQAVPRDLEEAAYLDGAGNRSAFLYITLPLALPSIGIAAIISFLMAYSEFAIGWLFVDKAQNVTLSMAIYAMVQTGGAQPWSILGSLVLVMSIPVIIVFIVFQRTFLERMLFGSIES